MNKQESSFYNVHHDRELCKQNHIARLPMSTEELRVLRVFLRLPLLQQPASLLDSP
jgi:hypothetical protein